jgi:Outer membrane protein beta-barrel domain
MISEKGRTALLAFAAALGLYLAAAKPAAAQFVVEAPKVEKGELEIEAHSAFQTGLPADDDAVRQAHELSVGYGLTDVWKVEVGFGWQKPQGDGFEASSIEIQNTFQLGGYRPWAAAFGLLASVSLGIGDDQPNAFEVGPLVQFGDERRSLTFNGIFEKTFGDNREEGVGFDYAAQAKFAIGGGFSLGAEAFGEIPDIGSSPSFADTELRAGPMLFYTTEKAEAHEGRGGKDDDDEQGALKRGDKAPELSAALGLLFGATEATPDMTVKWDLEIAF